MGFFCLQNVCGQKVSPVMNMPKDASMYVEIDDADHDFGNILFKKPIDYRVHVQNISKDTIVLQNVEVSCGCTVAQWKAGPYAPRDTFSINIGFNGYADGKFIRTVTLVFNDKDKNNIVKILRFRGVGYEKLPVAVDNTREDDAVDDIDATAFLDKSRLNPIIKQSLMTFR